MATKLPETPEPCSICQGYIWPRNGWTHGNNAQPVNDGRCCDDCNMSVVVPARIAAALTRREDPTP